MSTTHFSRIAARLSALADKARTVWKHRPAVLPFAVLFAMLVVTPLRTQAKTPEATAAANAGSATAESPPLSQQPTWQFVLQSLGLFLSGGTLVGLFNLWNAGRLERKRRRAEFVQMQLRELYGPLQFFASCNVALFEVSGKIQIAGQAEYGGANAEKWSEDLRGRKIDATIATSNRHVAQCIENNKHIAEILTRHYSLMEPADTEVFTQFMVDWHRHNVEFAEAPMKLPLEVYSHVGDVAFLRPEFIRLIERRFSAKKAELDKLM